MKNKKINIHFINLCIVAVLALAAIVLPAAPNTHVASATSATQRPEYSAPEQTVSQRTTTVETIESEAVEVSEEPTVFYTLTDEQRTQIEQVVSAESRGEPYDGQVAVAQCILNACLREVIPPEQVIEKYKYTGARVEPTDSVKKAVTAVFDRGEGITDEPILYFYAPAIVESEWHESQIFVVEIANHRFFKEGPEK